MVYHYFFAHVALRPVGVMVMTLGLSRDQLFWLLVSGGPMEVDI